MRAIISTLAPGPINVRDKPVILSQRQVVFQLHGYKQWAQVEKWQYIHLMALVPVRLPLCHGGRAEVKVRVKGQDTEPPLFYVLSV